MVKKLIFLILIIVLSTSSTVFADTLEKEIKTSVTATEDITSNKYTTKNKNITLEEKNKPIKQEKQNINGQQLIVKIYEVASEIEADNLKSNSFEDSDVLSNVKTASKDASDFFPNHDGYFYTLLTSEKNPKITTDEMEQVQTVEKEVQSKNTDELLKVFPNEATFSGVLSKDKTASNDASDFFPNHDDGNYMGLLHLDATSLTSKVKGYTTKKSTVSTTKEYTALMYADPSYVPQTTIKDGVTLSLNNINWVVTGTGLSGDSLVPTEYKAVASYSKTISNQVPTGYIARATYKGKVQKEEITGYEVKQTYEGKIVEAVETDEKDTKDMNEEISTEKSSTTSNIGKIAINILIILIKLVLLAGVGFGGYLIYKNYKSSCGASIYNMIEIDYICLGKQSLDYNNPIMDINNFTALIQSAEFMFVLDKQSTKKLFGKHVGVKYEELVYTHMVKQTSGEYKFSVNITDSVF